MKKVFKTLILLTVILPSFALAQNVSELQRRIEERAKELEQINAELKKNQAVLETTTARGKTLSSEVGRIDNTIKQTDLGIQQSEVQLDKLGLELNSLQNNIYDKELVLKEKKDAVARIVQTFQVLDNQNLLMTFLNSQSLSDSFDEATRLQELNNGLITELREIEKVKEALSQNFDEVAENKEITENENRSLKSKKTAAKEQLGYKNQLLTQTKNEEVKYQQIVSELEAKQQAIGQEIARIEAELRAATRSDDLPSKIPGILGLPRPIGTVVTQSYGATDFAQRAYSSQFHNGVDYRGAIGDDIFAAADGEVIAVGNHGQTQYGKYVLIKHANNLTTLYAHMSTQIVSRGQQVKRGQVVGYVGATGYVTGPHLHFTVYWSPSVELITIRGVPAVPVGVTVNPFDYL
ncbi:MAG: peptidoglycan DD-metalloendopeptidase family protein [bacterium]|nr:peptidoglycan DD-metalloendopeptidase family protein [bacterium]